MEWDLREPGWATALVDRGLEPVATAYVLEGLAMYLPESSLRAVLDESPRADGSTVLVTCPGNGFSRWVMGWVARALGEPFQNSLGPASVGALLVDVGWLRVGRSPAAGRWGLREVLLQGWTP